MRGGLAGLTTLLAVLGAAPPSPAQTQLTPTGGRRSTASVRATTGGFDWGYSAPVVAGSSLAVTYDVAGATLAVDALDIRLDEAVYCRGPHSCLCLRNQRFRLALGARPIATVAADGRFALTHAAVYEDEIGTYDFYCIFPSKQPPVDVTWQATGTVTLDDATGTLRLSDMSVTVDGTGDIDAATLAIDLSSGLQAYEPHRRFQEVGTPLVITGAEFTPGTIAKVFINTAIGPRDVIPEGLPPTAVTPTRWEGRLPWPWPLPPPDDHDLGLAFMSVHLVRTDRGYDRSNDVPALLAGSLARGVPSLEGLDVPLSPTSWDPRVAVPNVEKVYPPGALNSASGRIPNPAATVVNVFGASGNCAPPGGLVPGGAYSTWLSFVVPAGCPVGPGAFQVVDTITGRVSNAISAPLGEPIDVSGVTISGTGVTVTGTGFNRLTAVNFFARDGAGALANFGGYDAAGRPRLAVTVLNTHTLSFELPAGVASGACFVEALNPPFIDSTSSRSRPPGGECSISH